MKHDVPLASGTKLPLICTYTDNVMGNGFVAHVEMRGRILAVVEDDSTVTLYAVEPSGWAETARDLFEACTLFRHSYTGMLYDAMSEASDLDGFRRALRPMEGSVESLLESWREAVEAHQPEWAEKLDLDIEPAATMPYIRVSESALSSASNKLDPALPALAGKGKAA